MKISDSEKRRKQSLTVATKRARDNQQFFPNPPSKVQKIDDDKRYAAFVRHIKKENVDLDFSNKHFVDDNGKLWED